MKTIGILLPFSNSGGILSFSRNLVDGLSKAEFNCEIFYLYGEPDECFKNSFRCHQFHFKKPYLSSVSDIYQIFKKYSIVRRMDFLISNTTSVDFIFGIISLLFNLKILYIHHGRDWLFIDSIWKNKSPNIKSIVYYKYLLNIIYQMSERMVAVSENTKMHLVNDRNIHSKNICVIYNGISAPSICERSQDGQIYFGYVGRLSEGKGIFKTIEFIDEIKNINPNIGLKIFGDGELYNQIHDYIKKNKNINISLKGHIDNIDSIFTEIDYLILLSDSEGLPMSLIEAVTRGIPVIAKNVGGISEIICSESGLLINDENTETQTKIVCDKFIQNRFTISESELNRLRAKFSKDVMISNYIKIINNEL